MKVEVLLNGRKLSEGERADVRAEYEKAMPGYTKALSDLADLLLLVGDERLRILIAEQFFKAITAFGQDIDINLCRECSGKLDDMNPLRKKLD